MRLSVRLWVVFEKVILRAAAQGEAWFHKNLNCLETYRIRVINDGLGLMVSIRSIRGDELLKRFHAEVMGGRFVFKLELTDGVWSARFIYAPPAEHVPFGVVRDTTYEENFQLLLAHISHVRWWERRVADGWATQDTAAQYIEASLQAIDACNRLL
jgi:hypothetical protein